MKKEIKCSYALLVIILFAALAFVTDYIVIERKVSKCSCPDCTLSGNTNVVNDGTTKIYSYADLAGHYTAKYESLDDGYGNIVDSTYHLYLYSDATFYYTRSLHSYAGKIGTYKIDGNSIILNQLFSHGSDIGMNVSFDTINMSFNSNSEIILTSPDGIEDQSIILSKVEEYNENNNDSSLVKQRLNESQLYNEYMKNN